MCELVEVRNSRQQNCFRCRTLVRIIRLARNEFTRISYQIKAQPELFALLDKVLDVMDKENSCTKSK